MKGRIIIHGLLGLLVLFGLERKQWAFYEADPNWWKLRLWTRRN